MVVANFADCDGIFESGVQDVKLTVKESVRPCTVELEGDVKSFTRPFPKG